MALVRAHCAPLPAMPVRLSDSLGRVTAEPVYAVADYPLYDVAAMDGFALAAGDTAAASPHTPVVLSLALPTFAGAPPAAWRTGGAVPISTGARMPSGCDTVMPRERARVDGGRLIVAEPQPLDRNVRRRGEDALVGERVLEPASVITPAAIGALASYGLTDLSVRALPRIALFATGDELIVGTGNPAGGGIFDSNTPMVAALLTRAGFAPLIYPAARDTPAQLRDHIAAASDAGTAQIIISTGGVSVGDRDHVGEVLRAHGATCHFHGVSMRPGKPVLFATLPSGSIYFGLPGNPVAALVGARFFVLEAIRAMLGLPPEAGIQIASPVAARPTATLFLKVRVDYRDGLPIVDILDGQQSHRMRPLLQSNAWLVVEPAAEGSANATLFPLDGTF
jgi:molybdopterin molybdotransferase